MRTRLAAVWVSALSAGCGESRQTDAGVQDVAPERFVFDVGFFDAPTIDVPPPQDLGRAFDVMLGPIACVPTTGATSPETGLGRATFLSELASGEGVQNVVLEPANGLLWSAVVLRATAVLNGEVVSVPSDGAVLVLTRTDTSGHSPRSVRVELSRPIAGTVQLESGAAGVTVHLASDGSLQVGATTLMATPGRSSVWTLQFDRMGALAGSSSLAIPTGVTLRRAVVAPGGGLVIDLDTPTAVDFAGAHYDCDGVLVRSNVDSSIRWRRCLSPTRGTIASLDSVTVAPDGAVYATGVPRNQPDFGLGADPFDARGGGTFLVRFNPDGGVAWARHLSRLSAAALATGDGVYVSGTQVPGAAMYSFGDRALTTCATGERSYVGKFDVRGFPLWYSDTGDGGTLAGVYGNGDLLMTFAGRAGPPVIGTAVFPSGTALALARVGPDGRVLRMQSIAPMASGSAGATLGVFAPVIDADGHPIVPLSLANGSVPAGALGALSAQFAPTFGMIGINL